MEKLGESNHKRKEKVTVTKRRLCEGRQGESSEEGALAEKRCDYNDGQIV